MHGATMRFKVFQILTVDSVREQWDLIFSQLGRARILKEGVDLNCASVET